GDGNLGFDLLRRRGPPRAAAARALAEQVAQIHPAGGPGAAAEDLAEQVGRLLGVHLLRTARPAAPVEVEVRPAPPPGRAARETGPRLGRAEAVVVRALRLVAEHVVGLLHLLEVRLGLLVARVAVGVVLPRQLAVRLLDLLVGGVALDPQGVVIVAG